MALENADQVREHLVVGQDHVGVELEEQVVGPALRHDRVVHQGMRLGVAEFFERALLPRRVGLAGERLAAPFVLCLPGEHRQHED